MPNKNRPPRGPSPSARAVIPTPRGRTADALLAQYRSREGRTANEAAARSIWPTSNPCDRQRDIDNALVAARRTRGIAEGRRLARARMERFAVWLREKGACRAGRDYASQHLSPEHAVVVAASSNDGGYDHLTWLLSEIRYAWLDRFAEANRADADAGLSDWPSAVRLAVLLLRSPEWAALPWQREAGR